MPEREYPDVEVALMDILEAEFPELAPEPRRVDVETPNPLPDPFVRVELSDGAADIDDVTDFSIVDIDVLSKSRATAYVLARDIRSRLTGSSHRAGSVIIDRVVTVQKPRRLPWDDGAVWRLGATYRVSARRCQT